MEFGEGFVGNVKRTKATLQEGSITESSNARLSPTLTGCVQTSAEAACHVHSAAGRPVGTIA